MTFINELRSGNSLRSNAYGKLADNTAKQGKQAEALKTEKTVFWSTNLVEVRTIPALEGAERINAFPIANRLKHHSDLSYVEWKLGSFLQAHPELSFKSESLKSDTQPGLLGHPRRVYKGGDSDDARSSTDDV